MNHTAQTNAPAAADAAGASAPTHDDLVLTAKFLPIVAHFVAQGDIRYYLNGINVRPLTGGGVTICGTNGHILGVYRDPAGVCSQEVTLHFGKKVLAACVEQIDDERVVVLRDGRLTVLDLDGNEVCIQAGNPVIDAQTAFPRFEKVVPDAADLRPGLALCVSGKLLKKLARAANSARKALTSNSIREGLDGLHFFNVNGDVKKCTVAHIDVAPDFLAIVMPLRPVRDIVPSLPAWLPAERGIA